MSEFKTLYTKADIRADPRVDELWSEDDGFRGCGRPAWWCSLKTGWIWSDGVHTLHEATVAEILSILNNKGTNGFVERCYCDACGLPPAPGPCPDCGAKGDNVDFVEEGFWECQLCLRTYQKKDVT